ncbi:MAG: ATP-binding protein [Acidobacteria bacterium]|nr:ATP-binding protein [Acidobacteriota bacterium]
MSGRWLPRTLRVRLTAWHVAVMVVVLAIYVTAVLLIVTRNASRALDARLRSDFRWAAGMAQREPDGSLSWFEGDPWSEDSPWLQVWAADGSLAYRTAVARRLPVPGSETLLDRADGRIVSIPSEPAPFRVLARRITIGDEPVIAQVGRSEALMRQEIVELALVLLLGLPLSVVAAGLGGYYLARRALAPLARMTDRARAITASRLGDRLPIDDPRDELGRLAVVFNETLGRLEASFTEMRRFTANVSHELRTPLTAIRSVGEVGLREPRDPASYRAVVESMLEEADRLSCLVDQLLTVSRADGGERMRTAHIDLADLADDVAAHLGVLAEEKGQSMVVVQDGRPACRGDHLVLRQALINLVDNAIKYTPAGGRIEVRVGAADAGAVVEVCDNGPGVSARQVPRLFDRLYRGEERDPAGNGAGPADGNGAGLGLAIARWAVEANHGRLSYERPDGAGSVFRIVLPTPRRKRGRDGQPSSR